MPLAHFLAAALSASAPQQGAKEIENPPFDVEVDSLSLFITSENYIVGSWRLTKPDIEDVNKIPADRLPKESLGIDPVVICLSTTTVSHCARIKRGQRQRFNVAFGGVVYPIVIEL